VPHSQVSDRPCSASFQTGNKGVGIRLDVRFWTLRTEAASSREADQHSKENSSRQRFEAEYAVELDEASPPFVSASIAATLTTCWRSPLTKPSFAGAANREVGATSLGAGPGRLVQSPRDTPFGEDGRSIGGPNCRSRDQREVAIVDSDIPYGQSGR
jgi:hypothetical protein